MELISHGGQHVEDNPSVLSTANTTLGINHSSSMVLPSLHTLFHFNIKRIQQDRSDSLCMSNRSWITRHHFSQIKSSDKKNASVPFPIFFRFKCLLLKYQKAMTLCGFWDTYGFSKCSSWKLPISEVVIFFITGHQ